MIKVSVKSTEVRNQSGIAKASGKPYALNFQTVWIHTYERGGQPMPYPEKVEIILDKDKDGAALYYAPGEYTLHPSSIYVDRNGGLSVAPKLVAVTPAAKPAA